MFKRVFSFLKEYLRINAILRLIRYVEVRGSEIAGLAALAATFAIFEGMGISLLLPILQFAENGQTAISQGSGAIWTTISRILEALTLPITLPVLLVMAFVPILVRQVVYYLNAWYSAIVSSRIGVRMRLETLDKVLHADPEFFERHQLGDVVGVVVTQTTSSGVAILTVVKQLSLVLLMLVYFSILVAISVPLTLVSIASALVVSWAVRTSIGRMRESGIEFAGVSQDMMSRIVERFSLIRLIKLRDQGQQEYERIAGYSEAMRDIQVKQGRLSARVEITADPLLMLSVFITLYVGISVLGMTLAQLGLVLFVLTRLSTKLKEFNQGLQIISQYMGAVLLVRGMAEDAVVSNTIHRGDVRFTGLKRQIVFDSVVFEYPKPLESEGAIAASTVPVLSDLSLMIPAGSFTALVGRSGAGKSTLVELILRLRDVTDGSILIDDTRIREYDVGSLRKGIGYLTQNAMLFNASVRENLLYGLEVERSEAEMRSALEDAYATFVYDLPNGLDTNLGDQGVRVSGGERQRIALARVLLEDTSVLILDEPTSALDSESESYIQTALARLHGRKTIIVIAHRLATVIQADQLLVMDQGQIIERGTHDELMAKGAAYQRLFQSQLI